MPDTTNQDPEDYLASTDAARYVGVSTRTLLRYEESGRLAAERLPSGHRRYRRSELDKLRRPTAAPAQPLPAEVTA